MREHDNQFFVGLDIGTSAVRCIVATPDAVEPSKPAIVGHGFAKNSGMRKGVIAHIDDVVQAIEQALNEAERISGAQISSGTVNINGSHVKGINSTGVIAISSADRQIGNEDRLRAEEAATIVNLPPNREIVQVFAKNYRVDGQDNIKDPVGMHGVRLEVDTHIVTASTPNMKSLDATLSKASLHGGHRTVSSLAAAEAVMTREQKEAGTLLMDIGAGTTNLAIIEDGEVQYVGVIPVGGIHLTNDLAIGLKTDLPIAEKVKLEHATLGQRSTKSKVRLTYNKKTYDFDAEDITMITEARMEELMDLVERELRQINKSRRLPGGIVITGGSSQIKGIEEFVKEKLQLATRLGRIQSVGGLIDTVKDPAYITAIGLMMLDMYLLPGSGASGQGANDKAFGALAGLVSRLKRKIIS